MKIFVTVLLILIGAGVNAGEINPDALASLPRADVIILGEVHDNPAQHINQARAVAALKPAALVFEMLTPEQAEKATADNRGEEQALFRALGWQGTGWPDFSMYYPVFAAAPNAQIFGAAFDRKIVRNAVKQGAAQVYGKGMLRVLLDKALPPAEQSLREQGQMEAHCNALPASLLSGMVEAQRLRDAGIADAVLAARALTGGLVVVITGNGHARTDWGVPFVLSQVIPDLNVLSIAQFEVTPWGADVPFDSYVLSDAAKRDDPCAAFK